MFDIAKIPSAQQASEAGYTFDAQYPDGTPAGVRITVVGPDSEAAKAYATRRFAQMQSRAAAARRTGRDAEELGADELEQQMIELAATYTTGWAGVLDGGQPLPCTAENARRLYRLHPWLRSQVINEAQTLGNFVRPSLASFSTTPAPSSDLT